MGEIVSIWPKKTAWADEMPADIELATRSEQVQYELARLSVDMGRWNTVRYLIRCIFSVLRHGRIKNES